MKNQNGFTPIIIILVVFLGIGGVYFFEKLKLKADIVNMPSTASLKSVDQTTSWKEYTANDIFFKYPDRFVVASETGNETVFSYANKKPRTEALKPFIVRRHYTIDFTNLPSCAEFKTKFPCIVLYSPGSINQDSEFSFLLNQFNEAFIIKSSQELATRFLQSKNKNIELEIEPTSDEVLVREFNQILSTFKFLN